VEKVDKVDRVDNVQLSESWLRSMPKDILLETATKYGIETMKQGKTKVISRTRIELISDILSKK
jgi:hypothetical protein